MALYHNSPCFQIVTLRIVKLGSTITLALFASRLSRHTRTSPFSFFHKFLSSTEGYPSDWLGHMCYTIIYVQLELIVLQLAETTKIHVCYQPYSEHYVWLPRVATGRKVPDFTTFLTCVVFRFSIISSCVTSAIAFPTFSFKCSVWRVEITSVWCV